MNVLPAIKILGSGVLFLALGLSCRTAQTNDSATLKEVRGGAGQGETCGGVAFIQCKIGLSCQLSAPTRPDAGGTCEQDLDFIPLPHSMVANYSTTPSRTLPRSTLLFINIKFSNQCAADNSSFTTDKISSSEYSVKINSRQAGPCPRLFSPLTKAVLIDRDSGLTGDLLINGSKVPGIGEEITSASALAASQLESFFQLPGRTLPRQWKLYAMVTFANACEFNQSEFITQKIGPDNYSLKAKKKAGPQCGRIYKPITESILLDSDAAIEGNTIVVNGKRLSGSFE